jgi:hypothetical protein
MTQQTTREQRLEVALRGLLAACPEIGEWMFGPMTPAQREAYARAVGNAAEVLGDA